MKAEEKDSDRKAEVHIHISGQVKAIKEYDEYLDPDDGAICCYVPVNAEDEIRIKGRCSGTTLIRAYDVAIDGVLRWARYCQGKTVTCQPFKIDCDKFLYYNYKDSEVFETEAVIKEAPDLNTTHKGQREVVGTVEVRLFMLRKFGDEWSIGDSPTFDDEADPPIPTFTTVPQDVRVTFKQDSPALDQNKENHIKKIMYRNRPGKKPWAIFRFHLRSEEAIEKYKLEVTFDPNDKKIAETHLLSFDKVVPFQLGAKPPGKADSATPAPAPADQQIQIQMSGALDGGDTSTGHENGDTQKSLAALTLKPVDQPQKQGIGETTIDTSAATQKDASKGGGASQNSPLKQRIPPTIVTRPPKADKVASPIPSEQPPKPLSSPQPSPAPTASPGLGTASIKRPKSVPDLMQELLDAKKKCKGVQSERAKIAPAVQLCRAREEDEKKKLMAELNEVNMRTEMEMEGLMEDRRLLEYFGSLAGGDTKVEE